ncbi:hypothetical protein [Streptomyces sp. NPDC051162]|uniref:hypothetical protein n=1 Tax=Streptomyces sp. NPDC051162 TaxID=3154747 RepID=UPI0034180E46
MAIEVSELTRFACSDQQHTVCQEYIFSITLVGGEVGHEWVVVASGPTLGRASNQAMLAFLKTDTWLNLKPTIKDHFKQYLFIEPVNWNDARTCRPFGG